MVLAALLNIVVIDLVLSGDNSLVIGLAAHRLPPRRRRQAIIAGGAVAIALRAILTLVAAMVLRIPFVRLVGGLMLVGLAFRLLRLDVEAGGGSRAPAGFAEAMATIVAADAVMSLDNILGVAAAAHDDLRLLAFGLALSMSLMMFAGNAIATLLNKWSWLTYVGAAVIAWTGADMALRDVAGNLPFPPDSRIEALLPVVIAAVTVVVAHHVHRAQPGLLPSRPGGASTATGD